MIIKEMDDRAAELAALEAQARDATGSAAKRAREDLAIRRAGLKGERESAYLIDFHYKASKNWFIIHDLRLEQNGRTAQIDHLLLNRALDCYVLESKHFHAGIKITDDGEFLRWNDYRKTYEGMPSPLAQNARHVVVLKDVFKAMDMPTRLGIRLTPMFFPYVLVSPASRIDRSSVFDSSAVIKADTIRQQFLDRIENDGPLDMMKSVSRFVSASTAQGIAEQLANWHRPAAWPMPKNTGEGGKPMSTQPPPVTRKSAQEPGKPKPQPHAIADAPSEPAPAGPQCKKCGEGKGAILHGKYGYYFKCASCDSNTRIAFTCQAGHKPRLRKSRENFYRDCAECGTSQLYFVNTG